MKKDYHFHVGIDIAKNKLDYCIIVDPAATGQCTSGAVPNNEKGIGELLKVVKKQGMDIRAGLFIMENTGVYTMPLCFCLQRKGVDYTVVPPLELKRSKGMARGKNDRTDARDIALYAITHRHTVRPTVLPAEELLELKLLLAEREKLVRAIKAFGMTGENRGFVPGRISRYVLAHNEKTVLLLKAQLKSIAAAIEKTIGRNETFKKQARLLVSVPGIGKQIAANLIASTDGFTAFKNWRKFACYCGVAPFEYSSGSSIRWRTKVHPAADKKLKALLNIAAMAAKKHDPEIKEYFDRKVRDGKNKMSVLNAVRCKIAARAFAVIGRGTAFVNTRKDAA